jgi:hypothetical protein
LDAIDGSEDALNTVGTYVIWYSTRTNTSDDNKVVRVGQGHVGTRLAEHKNNPKIMAYGQYGLLVFSWATVPNTMLNGVERYLANVYTPLEGERYPNVAPIAVTLPGE